MTSVVDSRVGEIAERMHEVVLVMKGADRSTVSPVTDDNRSLLEMQARPKETDPHQCLCFGTLARADAPTEQPRAQRWLRNGRLICVSPVPSSAEVGRRRRASK